MIHAQRLLRALLSTEQLTKAMRALDRTALVMIVSVWTAGVAMMGLALYTITVGNKVRQQTEEARAIEPLVPVTQRAGVPRAELEKYADRLRPRYDHISFNALPDNGLEISASQAAAYEDWLTVLSYLDTIAPQVRWSIRDLCVGSECGSGMVMRAVVSGERVTFKAPAVRKPEEEAEKGGKS